ncbi:TPA: hypothetical protein QCX59_004234 [Bacillus mycoides]|uniref:Uncharacterized protein n=1 Tax=Bacillus cereus (strain VD146) TaxID=1053236 RepID=R8MFC1_BACCX|nr:hypothetical protein [Bacillus cereus]EOP32821.1 hypothetical protein IK1_05994 [Bacillus cereus VD146]HDR7595029.1 hypothetical protein [Bacillus mycoides]
MKNINLLEKNDMLTVIDITEGKNEWNKFKSNFDMRDVELSDKEMETTSFLYEINDKEEASGTMKEIMIKTGLSEKEFVQIHNDPPEEQFICLLGYTKNGYYFKSDDMELPYVGHVEDLTRYLLNKYNADKTKQLFADIHDSIGKIDFEFDFETLSNNKIHWIGVGSEMWEDIYFEFVNQYDIEEEEKLRTPNECECGEDEEIFICEECGYCEACSCICTE